MSAGAHTEADVPDQKSVHRGLSLRWRLMLLVAAAVFPSLVFQLWGAYTDYRRQTAETGARTLALARSMSLVVEETLQARIALLQTLSTSPLLRAGNFDGFREQAQEVVRWQFPNSNIVLLKDDGSQLVNTLIPRGEALPVRPYLESVRRAFATGAPVVSDLYQAAIAARLVIAIDVPVKAEDGAVLYALSLVQPSSEFASIIRNQHLPDTWVASVLDRNGVNIARVPNAERFVGQPASESFLEHLQSNKEGTVENNSLEGTPIISAFSHDDRSGWAIGLGVPRAELYQPVLASVIQTSVVGVVLFACGLVLALYAARRIANPIDSLRRLAGVTEGEERPDPAPTGLPEIDEVTAVLYRAEVERRRSREAELIFRDAMETIPEGFSIYDADDRLVMCNAAYRRLFPDSSETVVLRARYEDILRAGVAKGRYAEAVGREEEWIAARIREHRNAEVAVEQRLTDDRWVLVTKHRLSNGWIAGLRVDITTVKTAEEALRASEERLKRAQRLGQMGSNLRDLRTGAVEWSDETYRIYGVSRDTFVPSGPNILAMIHPNDRDRALASMDQRSRGIAPAPIEYRLIRPDGTVRHIYGESELIKNGDGNPRYVAGIIHDITGRKATEAALRESERRFQDIAEVSGDWMWETDTQHRFSMLFGESTDALLVRPNSVMGRTRWEISGADPDTDLLWSAHKADLDARRPFRHFRYEIVTPAGGRMFISASGKPVFDEGNNFVGYRGTATEETASIEARRRAEAAELMTRRIFETSLDLIVITDAYGTLVRVSPSAKLLLGYDPEEMIGRSGVEIVYHEDLERTRDEMRAARRTGSPRSFECRYVHREGLIVTFWWQGMWSATERQYFFSGRDITERKAAEQMRAYYAAIVESTADAIVATDLNGVVTSWNMSAERMFDYSASEMVGEPIARLLPSDRRAEENVILNQIRKREKIDNFETVRCRKDGTEFPVSLTISPILGADGQIIGASKIVRDITERRRMEENLRASERRLNRAQRLARMGSDIRNLRTDEAQWSEETYRIFGMQVGAPVPSTEAFLALVHPDDRAPILAAREELNRSRNPPPFEYRIVLPDGSVRNIYRESEVLRGEDGRPEYMIGTIHDVTERRRTEDQLRQAQKMEAIGNLTGGMAHDFNNLLGVVVGNLDLVRDRLVGDAESEEMVGEALEAAWRGADLTRRLLAFARRQPLRPVRVEVNELVSNTVRLLRRLLGEDVDVALNLGDAIWPVVADPAQLEASLANLANNARDAMPKGGRLIIATTNRYLDTEYATAHADVNPGDFVMIESATPAPECRRKS